MLHILHGATAAIVASRVTHDDADDDDKCYQKEIVDEKMTERLSVSKTTTRRQRSRGDTVAGGGGGGSGKSGRQSDGNGCCKIRGVSGCSKFCCCGGVLGHRCNHGKEIERIMNPPDGGH